MSTETMQLNNREILKRLIDEEMVGTLSLWMGREMVSSLLPFCRFGSGNQVLVHVSGLAKHTRGLRDGAPLSFLIHASVKDSLDPMQIPRVSFTGRASGLEKSSPMYGRARKAFVQKIPTSEITFSLGDFQLFVLEFEEGRLVAGFARAQHISADTLRSLFSPEPKKEDTS